MKARVASLNTQGSVLCLDSPMIVCGRGITRTPVDVNSLIFDSMRMFPCEVNVALRGTATPDRQDV